VAFAVEPWHKTLDCDKGVRVVEKGQHVTATLHGKNGSKYMATTQQAGDEVAVMNDLSEMLRSQLISDFGEKD
jgi:hypothetical protein